MKPLMAGVDYDELEPPKTRSGPLMAFPAEPIPDAVNEAFLQDLATERLLSAARALVGRPQAAEARQADWATPATPSPT